MNNTLYLGDPKKLDFSELVMAIIVVGLLFSMAIPRVLHTRTKSKRSNARIVLRQLYQLELNHYRKFQQYVPGKNTEDLHFSPLLFNSGEADQDYNYSAVVDSTGFKVIVSEIDDADGDGDLFERLTIDQTGTEHGRL